MTHELKIYERYFKEIINNNKHFELRRDRGFKVGDTLLLREIENDSLDNYTKSSITKIVSKRLHYFMTIWIRLLMLMT